PATRVFVTDNASGDGSETTIPAAIQSNNWSAWATFMPLARNGGFAYGNNQAIRAVLADPAPPKYVWLLNPDTVVVRGALKQLVDYLDRHEHIGIVGSGVINPDRTIRRSAFRFHTIASEFESAANVGPVSSALSKYIVAPPVRDEEHETDWVSGASMFVRREVFERIGLLDDGYFMYFEEADFCLRARRAGFRVWYVPGPKIVHLVGQSSGVTGTKKVAKRRPKYWFDSRHRYFLRNHGLVVTLLADVAWGAGLVVRKVWDTLRRRPQYDSPGLLWDFVRYNLLSWRQGR
ncbi:MAG: glycosyltransferase family 2 protein, partial [Tepidisphaeraceae bacterium]